MNDNYSFNVSNYKKRLIGSIVRSALESFSIVVISGARQVGKSTFLRNEFPDYKYISLDDFSSLKQAKGDPSSLWMNNDYVIIDEVQKAPEVLSAIKLEVDKLNRKIKFILSGSANLLLMKNICESLAGRAIYFEMYPFVYSEIAEKTENLTNFLSLWKLDLKLKDKILENVEFNKLILRGFMPPLIFLKKETDALLWWESYIKTYIERDLRDLSQIDYLVDFKRVLDSLAFRTGNVFNQTEISQETGISQPTVYRYIKLLEVSNIIKRVPAYFTNKSKRVVKSPKLFFVDPALSIYLSGYHSIDSLKTSREFGGFFETMIFLHLQVKAQLMVPKCNIFHWRSNTGKEVDFVLEQGKDLLIFEVKSTVNPTYSDIKNLLLFIDENPETVRGILIHSGNEIKWLHSKVIAIPWYWIG